MVGMNIIKKYLLHAFFPFVSREGFIPRLEIKTTSRFGWRFTRSERILIIVILLKTTFFTHAIFDYDRAILQSQKGNWQDSTQQLKKVLAEQPDRPDILYDLGVSAYKNSEFDKALTYFNKAAQEINAPQALREQAYFNAGNAHVSLKQLQEAIDAYDKVLALNPDHEKAQHNKEVVKKMLEQQKQKKEQEQEKENKEEDRKEQEKKEDQQNQQDQNKKDDQQEQQDKDKKDKNDQENQSTQKQPDENSDKQNNDMNQKQKKEQEKQDKSSQQKNEQGSKEKSKATDRQKQESAGAPADAKSGGQQKLSAALEHALNEREKKDAQLNKKMIKAMAGSQGGGSNGINCW